MAQSARSSSVLTPFSPSATIIAVVTPSTSATSSATPSSRRLASRSASCFSRYSRARVWISFGGVLVEAFDVGDLGQVDVGDLLDRGEAFGDQQLGDDLVDVERLHEQLRALGEFLLAALGLLLLGQDVDVPAGELRGEAHVLAAAADGQRKLALRHDDLDAVGVLVEHDLRHFGGRQRVDDEARRVRVPLDDVDLLALQLVDHGLHARAAHADAGADGIDGGILGDDRDLGAASPDRGRPT